MEGPTGVMKQLQILWRILELTDREMFAHLSRIGAESLHFAFRMLLVLFRRELSFNDSLRMWEVCMHLNHSPLPAQKKPRIIPNRYLVREEKGKEKTVDCPEMLLIKSFIRDY